MGFYIPGFIQKRILRYALSKFDVLDTDALGLDSLDIAWGKRSTFELRDVGLRRDKLLALLRLPDTVSIRDAKIRLLRLTIPADIHASGIIFEAEGVHVDLIFTAEGLGNDSPGASKRLGKGRSRPRQEPTSGAYETGVHGSPSPTSTKSSHEGSAAGGLPTTADLAQSFIDTEPADEKAQLKAAVARSPNVEGSRLNESLELDVDEGYGAALSLPWFVADFLQGVKARAQAHVKDIQINVCVKLDLSSFGSQPSPQGDVEDFRLRIGIDSLDLQSLSTPEEPPSELRGNAQPSNTDAPIHGKRSISVRGIRAAVLSDSSVLSFIAQFSGPPSPAVTHVSSFKTSSRTSTSIASELPAVAPDTARAHLVDAGSATQTQHSHLHANSLTTVGTEQENAMVPDGQGASYSTVLPSSLTADGEIDSDPDSPNAFSTPTHKITTTERDNPQTNHSGSESESLKLALDSVHLSKRSRGSQESMDPFIDSPLYKSDPESPQLFQEATAGDSSPDSDLFHSMPSVGRYRSAESPEDLTKSRIFSHAEASSMYQSAISQIASSERQTRPILLENEDVAEEPSKEAPRTTHEGEYTREQASSASLFDTRKGVIDEDVDTATGVDAVENAPTMPPAISEDTLMDTCSPANEDPVDDLTGSNRAEKGSDSAAPSKEPVSIGKEFFTITTIDVEFEELNPFRGKNGTENESQGLPTRSEQQIPGGFSASTVSILDSTYNLKDQNDQVGKIPERAASEPSPIQITVGPAKWVCDMTFIRVAALSLQQFPVLIAPESSSSPPQEEVPSNFEVTLQQFDWHFVTELKGVILPNQDDPISSTSSPPEQDILLEAVIRKLSCSQKVSSGTCRRSISIGTFTFGYKSEPIIAFDSSLKLRSSIRDTLNPTGHDVILNVTTRTGGASEITIMTLPLHIQLNLTRLDETFSWIGGLSGILELGNSVMSTATVTEPSSTPRRAKQSRRSRTVRFEGSGPNTARSSRTGEKAPAKVTARIGGLAFDLIGSKSSVTIDGTAVKVARRGDAIRVNIDRLSLKGPVLRETGSDTAVSMTLELVKLVYLQAPEEDDLDRLLALLAPSRDYDDSTGDILLDTFLRQRRQGTILRANVHKCKATLKRTKDLDHFSHLLTDLKKLAPVAKYLPEDDRPGLLTLARIENMSIQAETDHALGTVDLQVQDAEVGHVSLPSILLLGINSLEAFQGGKELSGSVISMDKARSDEQSDGDYPPMIHVRFIGDEMDPTLKIKLWNLRLEYHISTIMALLGLTETVSGEVIVNELVNSVATLTIPNSGADVSGQSSVAKPGRSKPMMLQLAFRDSAIGLNPRNSPARGLLHLANVSYLGGLPDEATGDMDGTLTMTKMAFLIVDNAKNLVQAKETLLRSSTTSEKHDNSQLLLLKAMGYISVSEISTASIAAKMSSLGVEDQKTVEVVIRDDLIVVETCADSTQTLISILNGLQPPMPPKKELKYRTEVVPVQDMLASLSGDDFAVYEDELNEVDYSTALDDADELEDDVPQNLEYVSTFYNPEPKATDDLMLESDLDSIGPLPVARQVGQDRMLASFHEQYEVAPGAEPLDFDDDHFANKGKGKENTRRWSSKKNAYEPTSTLEDTFHPFKLFVKDVHLIWNLFDGYDWQRTREAISQAVAEVETKAADQQARRNKRRSHGDEEDDEPVIEDFLFNSIYIGVGTNQNPRELARNINRNIDDLVSEAESYVTTSGRSMSSSPNRYGSPKIRKPRLRLQRSRHHKMTFELKGMCIDFLTLPPGSGETESSIDVRVRDLDIFDHVPTSTWKKFATYMHDAGERESGTNQVHLEILNVKPVPDLAASEIILKATVLPLRLHVDQDALDFVTRFFEFKDDTATPADVASEAPFIQRAEVNSIPVKLDFKPKRVDYAGLRSGRTTEFMNFMILDAADMVLRHVIIYGVSGFDRLGQTLNDIWMPDVKRNQLPGVLAGLAPVRPLVNVGAGVRDLIAVPVREYRKDGRVLRSVQKGAFAFAKTTTTELAKLGAKLAVGTHTALQSAETALSPSSGLTSPQSPIGDDADERPAISPYADLPIGVVQGLRGAYRHLERDLLLARDAIVAMPGEIMESGSAGGAARAVLRGAPTVILRPALGVTKAAGTALMGAATTLDRGERRRLEEKYKRH